MIQRPGELHERTDKELAVFLEGYLRSTVVNQVWLFENLRTTVINAKNHPNNWRRFGAKFSYPPNIG